MHAVPNAPRATARHRAWHRARGPLIVGLVVFAACIFGIVMRPAGFLSAFWPANAVLLGLLTRFKHLSRPATWASAAAAYVAADLITGGAWNTTLWLSCANLAGVATGVWLFGFISVPARQLRRQLSALYLFCICSAASGVAAIVGSSTGPLLFGTAWIPSLAMWFSSELINYVLITPVILTAPSRHQWHSAFTVRHPDAPAWTHAGPLLSLLAAEIASFIISGPGAIAFVVPTLLWCALTYSRFVTCLLCMAVCLWKTLELAAGAFHFTPDHWPSVFSLRIGITLLSLGPLAAACANASRDEVLQKLDHAVNFDFLTDALARGAFLRRANQLLARLAAARQPAAVLMLDIDHFKQVNDEHGHAAGDRVLVAFAHTISASLREGDLFGRLGGEEFAAVLPGATPEQAREIAQRLCAAVRHGVAASAREAGPQRVTVSIGAACYGPVPEQASAERMLGEADHLLYEAKSGGRDRAVAHSFTDAGAPQPH